MYGAYVSGEAERLPELGRAICRLCGVAAGVDGEARFCGNRPTTGEGVGGSSVSCWSCLKDHERAAEPDYAGDVVGLMLGEELTAVWKS